jgi:hypothetical protein
VVLERSFADELGVRAGSQVMLNGRAFRVAGVAVTAASTLLYPHICFSKCDLSTTELAREVPGQVWVTRSDAASLASSAEPLSYTLNLKLANPENARLSQVLTILTVALVTLQVLPALAGALPGIPGGIGLYSAVNKDGNPVTLPPLWRLVATVLGTAAAVAVITVVPAWLGTRRPASEVLQSELA